MQRWIALSHWGGRRRIHCQAGTGLLQRCWRWWRATMAMKWEAPRIHEPAIDLDGVPWLRRWFSGSCVKRPRDRSVRCGDRARASTAEKCQGPPRLRLAVRQESKHREKCLTLLAGHDGITWPTDRFACGRFAISEDQERAACFNPFNLARQRFKKGCGPHDGVAQSRYGEGRFVRASFLQHPREVQKAFRAWIATRCVKSHIKLR